MSAHHKNADPSGCPDTVLGQCDPVCARRGRDLHVRVGDTLALAAAYDALTAAADRLCRALQGRIPFAQEPYNAYWALRYGSDPQEAAPC